MIPKMIPFVLNGIILFPSVSSVMAAQSDNKLSGSVNEVPAGLRRGRVDGIVLVSKLLARSEVMSRAG